MRTWRLYNVGGSSRRGSSRGFRVSSNASWWRAHWMTSRSGCRYRPGLFRLSRCSETCPLGWSVGVSDPNAFAGFQSDRKIDCGVDGERAQSEDTATVLDPRRPEPSLPSLLPPHEVPRDRQRLADSTATRRPGASRAEPETAGSG